MKNEAPKPRISCKFKVDRTYCWHRSWASSGLINYGRQGGFASSLNCLGVFYLVFKKILTSRKKQDPKKCWKLKLFNNFLTKKSYLQMHFAAWKQVYFQLRFKLHFPLFRYSTISESQRWAFFLILKKVLTLSTHGPIRSCCVSTFYDKY